MSTVLLPAIDGRQEGHFQSDPAGKYCVTIPIILAAIYVVIRVMLYSIWLSDNAIEASGGCERPILILTHIKKKS